MVKKTASDVLPRTLLQGCLGQPSLPTTWLDTRTSERAVMLPWHEISIEGFQHSFHALTPHPAHGQGGLPSLCAHGILAPSIANGVHEVLHGDLGGRDRGIKIKMVRETGDMF